METEKHRIGNTTISIFRLSLDEEVLEFYDLADEMIDALSELADRAESILKKDFQGILGSEEKGAISEVKSASIILRFMLARAAGEAAPGGYPAAGREGGEMNDNELKQQIKDTIKDVSELYWNDAAKTESVKFEILQAIDHLWRAVKKADEKSA